jgi:hypothetical protein
VKTGGLRNYSGISRSSNVRFRHPLGDHLKDLLVCFVGIIEPRGVDKDELVSVFCMAYHPMRGDFGGDGFQSTTCSLFLPSEGVYDLLRLIN